MSKPDAYETLHGAIVTGELSPGERLVEEELAERLGFSRGAIRAAVLRLGPRGSGGARAEPRRAVRRFTVEEAVEILEARAALESLAAGYAAERRKAADARELQKIVKEWRSRTAPARCSRCPSATLPCTA